MGAAPVGAAAGAAREGTAKARLAATQTGRARSRCPRARGPAGERAGGCVRWRDAGTLTTCRCTRCFPALLPTLSPRTMPELRKPSGAGGGRALAVEVLVGEAVERGVQLQRHRPLVQAQRVQLGLEVAVHLAAARASGQALMRTVPRGAQPSTGRPAPARQQALLPANTWQQGCAAQQWKPQALCGSESSNSSAAAWGSQTPERVQSELSHYRYATLQRRCS